MPAIGPGDVLLRVRAAGVGLTVVLMTAVPGRVTSFPRIPGHEVAGEVAEVGSDVTHVKVGERVTCHFYLTCRVCRFCRSGRETLCTAFRGYVGMARDPALPRPVRARGASHRPSARASRATSRTAAPHAGRAPGSSSATCARPARILKSVVSEAEAALSRLGFK